MAVERCVVRDGSSENGRGTSVDEAMKDPSWLGGLFDGFKEECGELKRKVQRGRFGTMKC